MTRDECINKDPSDVMSRGAAGVRMTIHELFTSPVVMSMALGVSCSMGRPRCFADTDVTTRHTARAVAGLMPAGARRERCGGGDTLVRPRRGDVGKTLHDDECEDGITGRGGDGDSDAGIGGRGGDVDGLAPVAVERLRRGRDDDAAASTLV